MSEIQPSIERFTNRVGNYARFRPQYPLQMIGFFRSELGLEKAHSVADVGSGTGISARQFLDFGNTVYCVEPNAAMREIAERQLGHFATFRSINATAENTGLASGSVELVIAAQAFHWFAEPVVAAEFERILAGSGAVALVWNERSLDATLFLQEYEKLLLRYGTDYSSVRHDCITAESLSGVFGRVFSSVSLQNIHVLDFEGLKGRTFSSSYMPAPDESSAYAIVRELECLFAKHARQGKIAIFYNTNIFYTKY
ncbi:MAG: class I SAM-dependent methyltransferase [Blastocatellia bacterium]